MNKALLISIKPRFADAIFAGEKRFELRKVKPRVVSGDLVLVYVTVPRCQLEGAFRVSEVLEMSPKDLWPKVKSSCSLTSSEFFAYYDGKELAYAIGIAEAWPLATSVALADLRSEKITPPQGYRYLTDKETGTLLGG